MHLDTSLSGWLLVQLTPTYIMVVMLFCREDKTQSAGGCSLNTARLYHWLTDKPASSLYFGTVGEDLNKRGKSQICLWWMVVALVSLLRR